MREIASPLSGPFTTFGQTPIDIYKVGAYRPELAYSFYNDYYRRGRQPVNLLEAITHTRNGNATMTGDYGPELVTNGSFDTDTGWTKGTGWTISGSVASSSGAVTVSNLDSSASLVAGTAYEVSVEIKTISQGLLRIIVGSTGETVDLDAVGVHKFVGVCAGNDRIYLQGRNTFIGSIDNISVREVPKIQWAPHNLLTYSEDFSNAAWVKTDTTVTANAATAPDGTITADKISHDDTTAEISQNVTSVNGALYEGALFFKYIDHQWVTIQLDGNKCWVDIQNGVIGTDNITGTEITALSDSWYMVSAPRTSVGTTFTFTVTLASGDNSSTETSGTSAYIWGAHLYRSDLGGMVDVPASERAFPTATKYVSTTDAARYLPRVNHHAYNGSQWVNKGLLVESEARTNLVTYSEDFTSWSSNNVSVGSGATGPDGVSGSLQKIVEAATTSTHYFTKAPITVPVGTNTFSCFAKDAGDGRWLYLRTNNDGPNQWIVVDLSDGSVTEVGTEVLDYGTIDYGNGIYRAWFSCDSGDGSSGIIVGPSNTATPGATIPNYTGDGTSGVYAGFVQLEAGSTPSSYIPTSGSSVTRPAESITIPAANLPWPNPVYVTGEELVTNGTFDTDTSGWTANFGGVALSVDNQRLKVAVSGASSGYAYQDVSVTSGKVYAISVTKTDGSNTAWGVLADGSVWLEGPSSTAADGTYTYYHVATSSTMNLRVYSYGDGLHCFFDNISVKEINPLALSIQMKGEMTIADEDYIYEAEMVRWQLDANNYVKYRARTTADVNSFRLDSLQAVGGTVTPINMQTPYADVNINVPFNIASRHGSTFINGAVDGTALTANTTPVALPDLENTDLELGYDFMGTISLFRIWANDLGDTGIEEATEPSTEATLFLSFDGTENSYVNFDWSE